MSLSRCFGRLPVEVVAHHHDLLAAVGVGLQNALNSGVSAPAFAAFDVPPEK